MRFTPLLRASVPRKASSTSGTKPATSLPSQHHDLPSFLAHADSTRLSRTSTLYAGTHYEYTVSHALRRYGFSLTRTGGRADGGIDLLGRWSLPVPSPSRGGRGKELHLRALVQCKAHLTRAPTPAVVRELEGAFAAAPAGFRPGAVEPGDAAEGVLGVLATPLPATPGVRDALGRSLAPLAFFMVGIGGEVQQCLWNRNAAGLGLEGVGVTVRYGGSEGQRKEVALMWKGELLDFPDGHG